jgi:uncharacterized protein YaaW (UPF0174 family)
MTITTEQAYLALYKSLPQQVKAKLRVLIDKETEKEQAFLKRLEEIKQMPKRPINELLDELDRESELAMQEKGLSIEDINKSVAEMNKNRTVYNNKIRTKQK